MENDTKEENDSPGIAGHCEKNKERLGIKRIKKVSGDKGPCSFKKPLEDGEGRRATLAIFQIFIQGKELQCRKLKVCFVGHHDWWFRYLHVRTRAGSWFRC